jgi:adenylate cyclase class 2
VFVQHVEVERKYAVAEPDALKAVLAAHGGVVSTTTRQVDDYFNAPHKDFLAPSTITEWVRLRTSEISSFNYKCWHVDSPETRYADEFETPVGNPEAMRKALDALGFTLIVTVDKMREAWNLPALEVAFDTIAGLGEFVEFEFKGDADDPTDAILKLESLIAAFNVELGEQIHRGYPHMLLDRDE